MTAIAEVKGAGVQVVMITGDRKETAVAIAKDAGLLEKDTDVVLTSDELAKLSDEEIKKMLPNIRVIARALPSDKSRLVRLAQELDLVAGMTGRRRQRFTGAQEGRRRLRNGRRHGSRKGSVRYRYP